MTEHNRAILVRMLDEGRITSEQYEEFIANLPEEAARLHRAEPAGESPCRNRDSKIPWSVFTCAIFLFVASVLTGLAGFYEGSTWLRC